MRPSCFFHRGLCRAPTRPRGQAMRCGGATQREVSGRLEELAARREAARTSGGDVAAEEIEPLEGSLIWNLWVSHRGRFVPQAKRQRISPERSAEIMNEIRPMMEAMDKAARERRLSNRWPRHGSDGDEPLPE